MTQVERVLMYMNTYGSITPLDAMREFGIMRLASRISDIKRLGYDVNKEMVQAENRFGEKTCYARYSLR